MRGPKRDDGESRKKFEDLFPNLPRRSLYAKTEAAPPAPVPAPAKKAAAKAALAKGKPPRPAKGKGRFSKR